VIFLTARDEVPDRVRGFTMGGDDYVLRIPPRKSEAGKYLLALPPSGRWRQRHGTGTGACWMACAEITARSE
jgi:PleD family two-component response regulator